MKITDMPEMLHGGAVPYELVLFDMDGTLITGYMDNPDKDYHKWDILPGRAEKLFQIRRFGNTFGTHTEIGIVTNQAGVAFGHITLEEGHKKVFEQVASSFGINWKYVRACWYHPDATVPQYNDPVMCEFRKPSGESIKRIQEQWMHGRHQKSYPLTLFVGDREEDRLAAKDAGVDFQWAHDFFGDAPKEAL